jgi:hypothetical protein
MIEQTTDDKFIQSLRPKTQPIGQIEVFQKLSIEIAPDHYCRFMTWDDAKLCAYVLTIEGKTGWRFPNDEELGILLREVYRFSAPYGMQYWVNVIKCGRRTDREYIGYLTATGLHYETADTNEEHKAIFVRDIP